MTLVGIDLAGPSNQADTALVAIRADGTYAWHAIGLGDREILERLASVDALEAVALDAPLSYNPGGGDRPADAELRSILAGAGGASNSVMPPTMTRMAYLTLRGISVARLLRHTVGMAAADILEVHPASALILRGAPADDVGAIKESDAARRRIVDWLRRKTDLKEVPDGVADSDHLIAAAAAALAGVGWHRGTPAFEHPADPPVHPHAVVA